MAVSDVGVGVQFARTAILRGCDERVYQYPFHEDRKRAEELNREAKRLTKRRDRRCGSDLWKKIVKQLQG